MGWFVYALYNREEKAIYIGQTNNIQRRIQEHNNKRGKHFTSQKTGEWILIYKEEAVDRSSAIKREKQLKSYRGRNLLKNLIGIK